MRKLLIALLEKWLFSLTKGEYLRPVRIESSDIINDSSSEDIDARLPLGVGDVVVFESGKSYKVEYVTRTKEDSVWRGKAVRVRPIVDPEDQIKSTVAYTFSSLRKLNYYLFPKKYLIKEVIKNEFSTDYSRLTVEECHEMAISLNEEWSKEFGTNRVAN